MNFMNFAFAEAMGRQYDHIDSDAQRRADLIAAFMPGPAIGIIAAKAVLDTADSDAAQAIKDRAAADAAQKQLEQEAQETAQKEETQNTDTKKASQAAEAARKLASEAMKAANNAQIAADENKKSLEQINKKLDALLAETKNGSSAKPATAS